MPDKTLIYSKQTGEPPIPLTVRINWLPDGKIKPVMYWTPDGSLYEVKHIYEDTFLAHLKDKDAGIRFKVHAVRIEAPETCTDHRFAHQETYLYFADNRFCERNIIDERYAHAGKEYITVTLDIFPDCDYKLVYFWVKGQCYKVEETVDIERRGSLNAGGIGIRHKVNVHPIDATDSKNSKLHEGLRRMAALYFEINKWFVSVKGPKSS